jgi:hypothetical protein
MSDTDKAALYQRLRRETAGMLGYALDNLSPAQELRLNVVSVLRLEVDALQGRSIAGESFDLGRLLEAAERLEKLLPTPEPARSRDPGEDAREQLRRLIMKHVEVHRQDEIREIDLLRRENQELREEIMALRGAPPPLLEPKALPPPAETPPPKPFVNGIQPHEVERTFSGTEPWRPYVTGHGGVPNDLYWGGAWGRRSW